MTTDRIDLFRVLCSVWNVETKNGSIKVATIEQDEKQESMCDGCSAPCCKGIFQPVINKEEFLSRKFQMEFISAPDWLAPKLEDGVKLAVLAGDKNGCVYHNHETNLCMLWPDCPKSCLSYDCRGDDRPEIETFSKNRAKELGMDVGLAAGTFNDFLGVDS